MIIDWQTFCLILREFNSGVHLNIESLREMFSPNKLYFRPQAQAVRLLAIPSAEICCMVTTPSSNDLQIKALCTFHGKKNIQLNYMKIAIFDLFL